MKWRNGNGMGKMGMENGAGGERTTVVCWFMVLDLGEWAGGCKEKCCMKAGKVG